MDQVLQRLRQRAPRSFGVFRLTREISARLDSLGTTSGCHGAPALVTRRLRGASTRASGSQPEGQSFSRSHGRARLPQDVAVTDRVRGAGSLGKEWRSMTDA